MGGQCCNHSIHTDNQNEERQVNFKARAKQRNTSKKDEEPSNNKDQKQQDGPNNDSGPYANVTLSDPKDVNDMCLKNFLEERHKRRIDANPKAL